MKVPSEKKSMNSHAHRQRIVWADILRIVAAFAVVWIHVSAAYQKGAVPWEFRAWTAIILRLLVAFAVPSFFMLSGMLFLDSHRTVSPSKIATACGRLLRAYLFWSLVYLLILPGRPGFPPTSHDIVRLLRGSAGPLWFIPAILSCYIVLPPLKTVVQDLSIERWLLLSALGLVIVPETIRELSSFGRAVLPSPKSIAIFSFPLFYFLLGDCLNRQMISKRARYCLYSFGVAAFGVMVAIRFHSWNGDRLHSGSGPETLWAAMYSSALFLWFKHTFGSKEFTPVVSKRLAEISDATFGIFLIHELVMFGLRFAFHLTNVHNPFGTIGLIAIPFESLVVFSVSLFVVLLLKKLPFFKALV